MVYGVDDFGLLRTLMIPHSMAFGGRWERPSNAPENQRDDIVYDLMEGPEFLG